MSNRGGPTGTPEQFHCDVRVVLDMVRVVVSLNRAVVLSSVMWIALLSGLHAWLNLDLFRKGPQAATMLKVGFLPVT